MIDKLTIMLYKYWLLAIYFWRISYSHYNTDNIVDIPCEEPTKPAQKEAPALAVCIPTPTPAPKAPAAPKYPSSSQANGFMNSLNKSIRNGEYQIRSNQFFKFSFQLLVFLLIYHS
jgi:hypothetical protein